MQRAPCDVVFVRDRGLDAVDEIAVVTQRGPYGPTKVKLANAFAERAGARIRFVTAISAEATDDQVAATREFHEELADRCTVPVETVIVRGDDRVAGIVDAAEGCDLALVGAVAHSLLHDVLVGNPAVTISSGLDCTVLLVHPQASPGRTALETVVSRVAY